MPDPIQALKDVDLAKQLATNPEVTKWLAGMVKTEMLSAFSASSAELLAKAKQDIDREKALANSHGVQTTKAGRQYMNRLQLNEFFRCSFSRLARQGDSKPRESLDADGIITQSLAESVGSAGGYLVLPEDASAEVHRQADEPLIVWPLLTKRPTSKDAVTGVEITSYITPSTGSDAKSVSAVSTDVVAVTEPAFGEVTWSLRAMDARVPIKLNLLDDSEADLVGLINELVADAFRTKQESWPIVGTGVAGSQAVGICNAEAGVTAVSVANVTTVANILGFVQNLPARYRQLGNHRVMAGSSLYFSIVSTLATNVNSAQYLMAVLPRVVESAHVGTGKLIVGDFSRYIVYYNPLIKVVTQTVAERWTLEMVFQSRWDGKPVIQDAFRIGNVTTY